MPTYTLKVTAEDSNKRLDVFITRFVLDQRIGVSRTAIQDLIDKGLVKIKGIDSLKSHYKVKEGQDIEVTIEEKKKKDIEKEDIPLDIVYQDSDLAVINKPAGLVVHPAPGNPSHTLVNSLLHHINGLSDINPARPGIVHRLDKDTSGLLVVAKNNSAHLELARQFAEHSIKRKYVALVKGRMEFNESVIEIPIGRHPIKRKSMAAGFGKKTRSAKTYYRTLKRTEAFSLLELEPFTGRTHQLRVHLSFVGHPILGDRTYGRDNEFVRMALHAKYLGFIHPRTKKFIEFSSEMPEEFRDFIIKNS